MMPHYFPYAHVQYTVAPGLKKLGTDFGNGPPDHQVFQIGGDYHLFRQNKLACRSENIQKYYRREREQANTLAVITHFIASQLLHNYPQYFQEEESNGSRSMTNQLTGETILYDQQSQLLAPSHYLSLLDALASQVPEDLAIWQVHDTKDYLSAIHLCAPNHWAPAEKIGKPFAEVHAPVAGMEALRARYQPMLKTLLQGGTYVRFAWGLGTDDRLNHHPEPPAGVDPKAWQGRHFDPQHPSLFVRVERQTLTGFPDVQALLFTIRTYFQEVRTLDKERLSALHQAVATMPEESLHYKGLYHSKKPILTWMEALAKPV